MKTDNPLEKVIEKKVCDYAKSKGCIHYKFLSANCRGVPDRIIITLTGHVMFVEFKRKGKKLTPLQERHRNMLVTNSATYYMIDSIEKGKEMIDASC